MAGTPRDRGSGTRAVLDQMTVRRYFGGPASIDDCKAIRSTGFGLVSRTSIFPSTGSNNDYLGWLGLSSEKPAEGPSRLFVADETGFLVARQEQVTIFLGILGSG